jgi:hypothetical protein
MIRRSRAEQGGAGRSRAEQGGFCCCRRGSARRIEEGGQHVLTLAT